MSFDWKDIFLNDLTLHFALEILIRTLIMFTLVLVFLRLSGKKGVRQLSLFEVAIIISLGSAAGDPMFTEDSAIVPSLIVFVAIMAFYRLLTWLSIRSERVEMLLEGEPTYVIEDGMFVLKEENEHTFAKDEFLSEMRQQSIEHLGQVRIGILETNGNVSFFFYDDDEVKPGMPVLPKVYRKMSRDIISTGNYACTYCGHVEELQSAKACGRCKHDMWLPAIDTRRIS